ncbi:hypothetical protein CPLU01_16151, partial [Colletotrichum plurivorum]
NWERVEDAPREVVDPAALALDTSPNNATSLLPRQSEECAARTGWEWIVCENMPESWVKKTLFGAMLIYYSPRLLFEFLTSCGRLVYGGDYVWRTRSAGQLGRRSEIETQIQAQWGAVDHIYFKVPQVASSLQSRSVDSFGVVEEYSLYNEYSFDTAAQEIHYRATGGSFTSDASTSTLASGKRSLFQRQALSRDYVLFIEIHRVSSARTIASPECIANTLKRYVDRTSERHRSSCQPLHNRGSFMSNVNIHITPGKTAHRAFDCC